MEAMIDGQGQDSAPMPRGPVGGHMQKRNGIAASREGQGKRRGVMLAQPVVKPAMDRRKPGRRQPQSAWVSIWPARARSAGEAVPA